MMNNSTDDFSLFISARSLAASTVAYLEPLSRGLTFTHYNAILKEALRPPFSQVVLNDVSTDSNVRGDSSGGEMQEDQVELTADGMEHRDHEGLQRRFDGKYEIKEIYDREGKQTVRCLIAVVNGEYRPTKQKNESNSSDKQCYEYQSGSISITFRGTDTLENVLADVQFLTTKYEAHPFYSSVEETKGEDCQTTEHSSYHPTVHAGFRDAWYGDSLRSNVMRYVCEQVDELNRQNNEATLSNLNITDPVPSIDITGHSLGGSLAVLAAFDLAKTLLPHKRACIRVYTHGCPRVGNGAFAQQFDDSVIKCWNIINDNDIVPAIPHSPSRPILQKLCACSPVSKKLQSIGYQRHGKAVILKSNGELIVNPTKRQKYKREAKVLRVPMAIKSHETGEYRAHMLAAIQSEVKSITVKSITPENENALEAMQYAAALLESLSRVIAESKSDPTRSFRILPGAT